MYPDLMSASSVDFDFDQRELAVGRIDAAGYLVVGDGLAASGVARSHAGAASAIATDARRDGSRVLLDPAVDQRDVFLRDFAARELIGELAMGFVVLGDYDQAAGFLVEAMDDAGAHLAADSRETGEVMQ